MYVQFAKIRERYSREICYCFTLNANSFESDSKDRPGNNHGGVIAYVKEQINFVRRQDLEILNVECIWPESRICNNKRVLLGTFYRPPNSQAHYLNLIENSIGLAFNTGIKYIIITGDFNLNTLVDSS